MELPDKVIAALNAINPHTEVDRLTDMLEIAIAESHSPLCVLRRALGTDETYLDHVVTQEMHVLHSLARQDADTVSLYLAMRAQTIAGLIASPSCIPADKSLPFVWYARALIEQFQKEPTAEKWLWISRVIQRNLLENVCPKAAYPYHEPETVHFHVYASHSEAVSHPPSRGVFVCATPTYIYVVTPSTTRINAIERLGFRICQAVEGMKAPRLSMQTTAGEGSNYNIYVIRGGHPLYEAALGTTLAGQFELKGCAAMTDAAVPATFEPPTRQTEAIFLFAFDTTGKGIYDFRQPKKLITEASVSITDR